MPREHRKRGKRRKGEENITVDHGEPELPEPSQQEHEGQPSWIEDAPAPAILPPEAPFGFCDPDLKAYFRTVDNQLREWQELGILKSTGEDEDPNLGDLLLNRSSLQETNDIQREGCFLLQHWAKCKAKNDNWPLTQIAQRSSNE